MYVCAECHEKDKEVVGCTVKLDYHDVADYFGEGLKRCSICGRWVEELFYCPAYENYRWTREYKASRMED